MNRRNFLRYAATAGAASLLPTSFTSLKAESMSLNTVNELSDHLLENIQFTNVKLSYPRLVGKNSHLGIHGHGPSLTICRLTTNQGASGIGMMRGSREKAVEIFDQIKGKKITNVFALETGVTDIAQIFDIPLHDLAGVILNKPVYQLLGSESPIITKCYSGMIYMDDVDIKDSRKAFDKILQECFYDYSKGYCIY